MNKQGLLRNHGFALASSAGVVIGYVQKLDYQQRFVQEFKINADDITGELTRLNSAIKQASDSLQSEIEKLSDHHHASDLVPILETHRMMLYDPELLRATELLIENELINAEWALKKSLSKVSETFDHIQDVYIRSRKADIEHVGQRIFSCLAGVEVIQANTQSIMVARDFSPSDIVTMWRLGVSGFVSVQGGENSHAMIVARGIGLPGLVVTLELFNAVEDGQQLIIDAEKGEWVLNPNQSDLEYYSSFQHLLDEEFSHLQHYVNQPSKSADGYELPLMANLEFLEEIEVAKKYGVDGIGLFRTEYLFMQAETLPSEDEQYDYYAEVVREMAGKPVTFRLLDIGADKLSQAAALLDIYDGENPALGLRGIRLLLHKPEMLKTQLRAMLRASLIGELTILVPMVTSVHEMVEVRKQLDMLKLELGINNKIALGCMIEVPAAVFIAHDLAQVSDFFSIGSNDLLQYSLAVDRADERVSYLYDAEHPAILKLIQMTVDAALAHHIPISICGELAANHKWTQSFLHLNITSLSMAPRYVLPIRKQLHHLQAL